MQFLFFVAGAVLLIEGIPYFLFPRTVKGVLSYLQNQEDRTLRTLGFGLIVLGVISAFLGRL